MLRRQKIILALLDSAGKPLSRTIFVKLSFLLGQETEIRDEATFYRFVPYQYGPFSFALYRELDALANQSYVVQDDGGVRLDDSSLVETRKLIADLPASAQSSVRCITSRYASKRQRTLLRELYSRYPWYAVKSELADLLPQDMPPLPSAPIAVYTVGYEGKSVDGFFDGLLRAGIRAIADVRANPVSRKYGFARSSLSGIAAKLSIGYKHFPQLGIPSAGRAQLTSFSDYQRLLDRYESKMLPDQAAGIDELSQMVLSEPTALVCMEKDIRCCHRSRLAKAVARTTKLPVEHLP